MENNNNGGAGNNQQDNTNTNTKNTDERLFTQAEVNEIIRKRLERKKASDDEEREYSEQLAAQAQQLADTQLKIDEREKALTELQDSLASRESLVTCKEYLHAKGYPADLINILETSDPEQFKVKADAAVRISGAGIAPLGSSEPTLTKDANVKGAFSPDYKHTPKEY